MGFSPTVRVAKIRRSGKLGEIAVCVDELDGVGTFLELERLVSAEESAAAVQDELASFVTELGVEAERTEETYDTLVQRT
jgi:adenylate cyclase, class 2